MLHLLRIAPASLPSGLRLLAGIRVTTPGPRPEKPLILYEFEACPFCRRVREALSMLDLEAEIRPCPRNGARFRPEVTTKGGKAQFPYLVDPNTGESMYESEAIVNYLFAKYGAGEVPLVLRRAILGNASALVAAASRPTQGFSARPSRAPAQPLALWSFEASPYCRIVRELLCELEIPYLLHNVAKGSPRRAEFVARSGKMQVPYLVDPNTGTEMFESRDIRKYLEATYGASPLPA